MSKDWPWKNPISETRYYCVYEDKYPVTEGHLLFVPKKNKDKYLREAFEAAAYTGNLMLDKKQADGYNIGYNCGTAAGQTVMWPHIHLIPRRKGDCEDPVGGVRGVIPGKANYKREGHE